MHKPGHGRFQPQRVRHIVNTEALKERREAEPRGTRPASFWGRKQGSATERTGTRHSRPPKISRPSTPISRTHSASSRPLRPRLFQQPNHLFLLVLTELQQGRHGAAIRRRSLSSGSSCFEAASNCWHGVAFRRVDHCFSLCVAFLLQRRAPPLHLMRPRCLQINAYTAIQAERLGAWIPRRHTAGTKSAPH